MQLPSARQNTGHSGECCILSSLYNHKHFTAFAGVILDNNAGLEILKNAATFTAESKKRQGQGDTCLSVCVHYQKFSNSCELSFTVESKKKRNKSYLTPFEQKTTNFEENLKRKVCGKCACVHYQKFSNFCQLSPRPVFVMFCALVCLFSQTYLDRVFTFYVDFSFKMKHTIYGLSVLRV